MLRAWDKDYGGESSSRNSCRAWRASKLRHVISLSQYSQCEHDVRIEKHVNIARKLERIVYIKKGRNTFF